MHPFTNNREESFKQLGEAGLLRLIKRRLGDVLPPAPVGMGDDCAVLPEKPRTLVTIDPVVYGKHFDDAVAPADAAAKLVKRNLSDIAAMGGLPLEGFLGWLVPPNTSVYWLEHFVDGLATTCRQYGLTLNGGDIASSNADLAISLTLTGHATHPVLRGHAKPGDHLFVTGTLGGSILGKHLSFEPRLQEGQWLGSRMEVVSMIDISDGLAKDLPTLLANRQESAIALDLEKLPIADAAHEMAKQSGKPAWQHALCDGEDYELAFAIGANAALEAFQAAWNDAFQTPLQQIGTVADHCKHGILFDASTGNSLAKLTGYWH